MTIQQKLVLVIEDELTIAQVITAYLEKQNYQVLMAVDGEKGYQLFQEKQPDLVILDLMLPKLSGEEVCVKIREASTIPILMLTAKITEEELLNGFHLGADDYMTKPFSPRELMVRVESLIKRTSGSNFVSHNLNQLNYGELFIDLAELVVEVDNVEIHLTPNERKLLFAFVKYPHKIFTREELIRCVFQEDFDGFDRTIDSHIKNLRSKIEKNSQHPKYILTVRGIGYRFGQHLTNKGTQI